MNAPPPNPYAPPGQAPPERTPGQPPGQEPILGGLIPRNSDALIAYYCGVFSIIPCLGTILGPIALIYGIRGVKLANREPHRKGKVHAWVGIVAGGLCGLLNLSGLVLWLVVMIASRSK